MDNTNHPNYTSPSTVPINAKLVEEATRLAERAMDARLPLHERNKARRAFEAVEKELVSRGFWEPL